jgi:hypothetical protein
VSAAWLVTGPIPILNTLVRPRGCRCWDRRRGSDSCMMAIRRRDHRAGDRHRLQQAGEVPAPQDSGRRPRSAARGDGADCAQDTAARRLMPARTAPRQRWRSHGDATRCPPARKPWASRCGPSRRGSCGSLHPALVTLHSDFDRLKRTATPPQPETSEAFPLRPPEMPKRQNHCGRVLVLRHGGASRLR